MRKKELLDKLTKSKIGNKLIVKDNFLLLHPYILKNENSSWVIYEKVNKSLNMIFNSFSEPDAYERFNKLISNHYEEYNI